MDTTKSSIPGTSDDATKTEQASAQSKSAVPHCRMNMQMIQNVVLIWLDNNIDENNTDCRNIITQLRCVVNGINTFTDVDQCADFLTDNYNENVCMLISGALCQNVVPLIHNVTQLYTIIIFCENKKEHEQWAKNWYKIKGIYTEILPLCEVLKQIAKQCEQNATPISFITPDADVSKKNLDQLDSSFMYTQILKEILLEIAFDAGHIKQFVDYCRDICSENQSELKNVEKLQRTYHDETPIWWYTSGYFLYSMLNRALRLMDVNIIMKMGFFIGDLHRHIEQLHKEQFTGLDSAKSFTVYRGQSMSKTEFEQMRKHKGGLISFNNFLSTSKNRNVSLFFTPNDQSNPNLVGILFVLTIDPSKSSTPFASISDVTQFQEEDEVLFAMNTVFRICNITPMGENHCLFQVELTLTSDDDKDLRQLTDQIREETFPDSGGWYRLSLVLLQMGEPAKAEEIYQILLDQATEERAKAPIYSQFGRTRYDQGDYKEAIKFYEKALAIKQQSLPPNHPDLASSYNNIGSVYFNMGEYSKALLSHEKALAIQQQSLPPNHPDLAGSYNNIGNACFSMGEYSKALSSYEKALAIRQQSLPPNHPDLASSYNNIGMVYENMGEYSKALSSQEKALAIKQQSLPPNHPDLASSYNNIGSVYFNMGEYSKALLSHEKALAIRQQSLPPNHPHLAMSYNDIGNACFRMGEYSKALLSHEKALAIRQQSLPPNHPDLAGSYNNIGSVYSSMGEYWKALSSHEKALAIQQQSLPPNHPDLASSYNNIGNACFSMGEYSKALLSHEKALAIRQQSLPPNHPHLAMSYNNIGNACFRMGEYSKALSSYEKALAIQQQSLPPNHPDLAISYNHIGAVYNIMGDCSEARSFYKRAVGIGQQSLPSNHPHLLAYRKNLNNV